jgi:ribose transport system permease protein
MVKGGIIVLAVLVQQIQFKSLTQFFAKNSKITTS